MMNKRWEKMFNNVPVTLLPEWAERAYYADLQMSRTVRDMNTKFNPLKNYQCPTVDKGESDGR
jgi:hypothetical protein